MRPLHPALRMEVRIKHVMMKEKKREVPVREAPVHEAPVHEIPSVDQVPVPSGDRQAGVDNHHVPLVHGKVVHEDPDSHQEVVKAPLEEGVHHIPETVQLVDQRDLPSRTASTARRCITSPMLRRGRGPGELRPRQKLDKFTLGGGGHN